MDIALFLAVLFNKHAVDWLNVLLFLSRSERMMIWRQLTSVMAAMAALVLARSAADQVDLAKLCHDAPGSGLVKLEEICAALRTILRSASGKYGETASQYITQNSMRSLVLFSNIYGAKGYPCLKYACAIMMHYRFLLMVTFDQLKASLLELSAYSGLKGDSRKKTGEKSASQNIT